MQFMLFFFHGHMYTTYVGVHTHTPHTCLHGGIEVYEELPTRRIGDG